MYKSKGNEFRTYDIIRTYISYGNIIMSRVFAYCRVSTLEQTTDNQKREIETAGFFIEPQRCIQENIRRA